MGRTNNIIIRDNLPHQDILASEIIETIEAGFESFKEIMETINGLMRKGN